MRSFLGPWGVMERFGHTRLIPKSCVLAHIGLSHFVLSLYNAGHEPTSPYEGQCSSICVITFLLYGSSSQENLPLFHVNTWLLTPQCVGEGLKNYWDLAHTT